MNPYYRRFDSPLMRLLALIMGGLVMVGAFFVGAFVLTIAIGLFVVIVIMVSLRVWWLRRQMRHAAKQSGDRGEQVVIEGEYVVHTRRRPGDEERRG